MPFRSRDTIRGTVSVPLLTDLYQLTMASAYWQRGIADREAVFHLGFRSNPFDGGYTIAAGMGDVRAYLAAYRFHEDDLAWLAELRGTDDRPLLDGRFIDALGTMELSVDIDAVAEGTVVFPHTPIVRVRGPIMQCQLLETALLNIVNFQTLVATKASRIVDAAGGGDVLEFGLRRAQGFDGALAASRAAFIGGCAATSNVLAGRLFGIPVRGTHAHSWVMAIGDETEAFEAWGDAMPGAVVLLVDTFDTLRGVERAIAVGRTLRDRGVHLAGIRLDSGDLAYLSSQARRMLDEAGFESTRIVASNDLDEHVIQSLRDQDARIETWGVGTRLVTSFDQPALGGVYKLSALREPDGSWRRVIKVGEQTAKISTPGCLQVRRFESEGAPIADMVFDEMDEARPWENERVEIVDPVDAIRRKRIDRASDPSLRTRDLLEPIVRAGRPVDADGVVHQGEWNDADVLRIARDRAMRERTAFHPGVRRLLNPHRYPAGLEHGLAERRTAMALHARES